MSQRSQRDGDDTRLPDGMTRIGYDADAQIYTFEDEDGQRWESEPGNQYGKLHRAIQEPLIENGYIVRRHSVPKEPEVPSHRQMCEERTYPTLAERIAAPIISVSRSLTGLLFSTESQAEKNNDNVHSGWYPSIKPLGRTMTLGRKTGTKRESHARRDSRKDSHDGENSEKKPSWSHSEEKSTESEKSSSVKRRATIDVTQ